MKARDTDADQIIVEFLDRSGLVPRGQPARFERLAGGVSSDIWIVRTGSTTFCVKRALPRLRVAADSEDPLARSATQEGLVIHRRGGMALVASRALVPGCDVRC